MKSLTVSLVSPYICHEEKGPDLFIKFFFFFNWVTALQCCVGFCGTTISISHKYIYIYIYIPSLLKLPSSLLAPFL